ncbi:MAG: Ig-like domain-containing protein [Chloroflexota bacterium]|nr:Ig-like domain-containing protein [Chloroflexota bacterium]
MTQTTAFTRFDRIVWVAAAVLLIAVGATIALGDRVGVEVVRASPVGEGHTTSPIVIAFSEPMDRPTVESVLRTEPPLSGTITWNSETVTFTPDGALLPGSTYTVILEGGARAASGRQVIAEHRFSFEVASLRVGYLFPADGSPQNIWLVDPAVPDAPRQITQSPTGIFDFAVSPNGNEIAFSEANPIDSSYDIKLIDLETGGLRQLTNCLDASCTNPVWHPNGRQLAYERVEYNSGADSIGQSPTRIWLLDLATSPASTRPLFNESQILGYSPQWSADGSRIALYDRASVSTLVHDLTDGRILAVPNPSGAIGALSPDGTRLAYTELILIDGGGSRSSLKIVDLASGSETVLTAPDQGISDQRAQWSPDGMTLAVGRQNPDVIRGSQIVLVDPDTGAADLLTDDPRYANAFFWYDPTGTQMLVQRFPELGENMQPDPLARPEIWTFDMATGAGIMLARNGFLPRWVP